MAFPAAGGTAIGLGVILDYFELCGDELQFPANVFLSYRNHFCTACRTDLPVIGQRHDNLLERNTLEHLFMSGLGFLRMGRNCRFLWGKLGLNDLFLKNDTLGAHFIIPFLIVNFVEELPLQLYIYTVKRKR